MRPFKRRSQKWSVPPLKGGPFLELCAEHARATFAQTQRLGVRRVLPYPYLGPLRRVR